MHRRIRFARPEDAPALEQIENEADRLFDERFRPETWPPAPTGAERLAEPGFLLVVDGDDGGPVGFAHVLERDGVCHLEQLSVTPGFARQGLGRALVEAAKDEARTRGHEAITLRTYADVPWNAPFYATAGFVEVAPSTPFDDGLVVTEARLGLDRYGRRVQMVASLREADAPNPHR